MHMAGRADAIKDGFAILKLKNRSSDVGLKVGLKVGKNVGKKVGFSSGPDSNNPKLGFPVDQTPITLNKFTFGRIFLVYLPPFPS